eukprot:TRINITY_DN1189_c0_g1_i1.p1 TRINITY_DN1189_c0_g1~~TRINITY_DN1189_c0_g1_i1.p1  ORF type:complete len:129 (-),score=1.34 TRINITY_DN1189_c0_g1_i1:81-467(-)
MYLQRNKSIVVDTMVGQLRTVAICPDCGYRDIKFEIITQLTLPIPRKDVDSGNTLQNYIKEFGSMGLASDGWYCSSCNNFVSSQRKYHLWKLPDILIIHPKRFISPTITGKVNTFVNFPINDLKLNEY